MTIELESSNAIEILNKEKALHTEENKTFRQASFEGINNPTEISTTERVHNRVEMDSERFEEDF